MMKGKTRKRTFRAIYRLLDRVSPVPFDCGRICGAVCCQQEEGEEMGLFLLPGEEKIHDKKDAWLSWEELDTEEYDFPASWKGKVFFVNCRGPEHCRRSLRPIQCRTFPLKPCLAREVEDPSRILYREEGEELALILSDDALPYHCPLIESRAKLDEAFIKATYTVWKHLMRDPLIYDLLAKKKEESI